MNVTTMKPVTINQGALRSLRLRSEAVCEMLDDMCADPVCDEQALWLAVVKMAVRDLADDAHPEALSERYLISKGGDFPAHKFFLDGHFLPMASVNYLDGDIVLSMLLCAGLLPSPPPSFDPSGLQISPHAITTEIDRRSAYIGKNGRRAKGWRSAEGSSGDMETVEEEMAIAC